MFSHFYDLGLSQHYNFYFTCYGFLLESLDSY